MKKLIIFLCGTLLLCPPFSSANEIKTYPAAGVFLSDGIKSEEFKTLFEDTNIKKMFIANFLKDYRNNFSDIAENITDRNKYKTIVSYISIPRVSKYVDKRPTKTIIYLPLTLSLNFTNIVTGETLYSTSHNCTALSKPG